MGLREWRYVQPLALDWASCEMCVYNRLKCVSTWTEGNASFTADQMPWSSAVTSRTLLQQPEPSSLRFFPLPSAIAGANPSEQALYCRQRKSGPVEKGQT